MHATTTIMSRYIQNTLRFVISHTYSYRHTIVHICLRLYTYTYVYLNVELHFPLFRRQHFFKSLTSSTPPLSHSEPRVVLNHTVLRLLSIAHVCTYIYARICIYLHIYTHIVIILFLHALEHQCESSWKSSY